MAEEDNRLEAELMIYWLELLVGVLCVAFLGNHYNNGALVFCLVCATLLLLYCIAFLMLYTIGVPNRITKKVWYIAVTIYQLVSCVFYIIIVGIVGGSQIAIFMPRRLRAAMVFCQLNIAVHLLGALVAICVVLFADRGKEIAQPTAATTQVV